MIGIINVFNLKMVGCWFQHKLKKVRNYNSQYKLLICIIEYEHLRAVIE